MIKRCVFAHWILLLGVHGPGPYNQEGRIRRITPVGPTAQRPVGPTPSCPRGIKYTSSGHSPIPTSSPPHEQQQQQRRPQRELSLSLSRWAAGWRCPSCPGAAGRWSGAASSSRTRYVVSIRSVFFFFFELVRFLIEKFGADYGFWCCSLVGGRVWSFGSWVGRGG